VIGYWPTARTRVGGIRVGDVVVLEPGRPRPVLAVRNSRPSTAEPAYWLIKRVVAVPGDPVPPGSVPARLATPDAVVPWGKLVVIGDNASASSDSRQLGYYEDLGLPDGEARLRQRLGHLGDADRERESRSRAGDPGYRK
jgi:hypothetical protein